MCVWKTRVRCSALLGRFYTKDRLQRWCEELTHVKLLRQSLVARHWANLFNSRGPEKNKSCCLHAIEELFMDYFNKDLLKLAIAFSHIHVTKQTTRPTRQSLESLRCHEFCFTTLFVASFTFVLRPRDAYWIRCKSITAEAIEPNIRIW